MGDPGTNFSMKILTCSALFGQAAVAESQGDIESARTTLQKIVETANPDYPDLAEQATFRMSTLEPLVNRLVLPNAADLPTPPEPEAVPDPLELLRGQLNLESATPEKGAGTPESSEASSLILEGGSTTPPAATPATATEPAPTEPAASEPAASEPATSEPATTEPAAEPSGDGG